MRVALSHAQPGAVVWVTAAETVLAAFLWAAFIAVFARKYLDDVHSDVSTRIQCHNPLKAERRNQV